MLNRIGSLIFTFIFCNHIPAAQAASLKLVPPDQGAYHSAYMDFGATASEVSTEKIRSFQATAGKNAVWAYFANDWLDGKIIFPTDSVRAIQSQGLIPYLRLMPWSQMAGSVHKADPIFNMQSFLSGKHDTQLKNYFLAAKNEGPLMMEFGPEVNGDWFPWNGKYNGGSTKTNYGDPSIPDGPERFRDVYRRIITLARSVGANNITWVLHIDSARSPESEWNDARYYFPGDDYIDWIGISVFGAQLPTHGWEIFDQKLDRFLPQLTGLRSTKPWLIAEFAAIEDQQDSTRKATWIHQAFQAIEKKYKNIKGVSYWHSKGWLANGKANFKIDSSEQALAAYREEVANPHWVTTPKIMSVED